MADGKEAFDAYRDQVLSALSGSQTSGEGLKTRLSNLQKVPIGVDRSPKRG